MVGDNLQVGSSALSQALFDLDRLSAPDELEAQVAAALKATPPWTRLLEELPSQSAPHVLERLVSEELADPSAAVTRRFAGGLPHKISPESLERDLEESLVMVRTSRPWWKPVGGLVAAAVLAWAMIPMGGGDGGTDSPHFRLIEVQSFASLDSMARPIVLGLAGSRVESPTELGSAR